VTAPEIVELDSLTDQQAAAVLALVHSSPGAADNPPISERGLLHLQAPVRHLVAEHDGQLIGYAQVDHGVAELVAVDAAVARKLLDAITENPLKLWAHGADSVANHAAQQIGLEPVRSLLQMRRSLDDLDVPASEWPPGVVIRPFVPGRDDEAWLAVNARAFATHPEQGSWADADLADRVNSDWFDAAGFLVADRDGELLGYHWTKVHTDTAEPMGEVYVLGVDPAAQGLKLGKLLLAEGLRYLKGRGLHTVLLYADATNTSAVALYTKLGFTVFSNDIQYSHGDTSPEE
jgi:mycothiol synthase